MDQYKYIDSEDYYELACQWIKLKEYNKAEDFLHRTIDLNPGFIYAYITMAKLYAKRKDYHNSIHILKRGLRVDPYFDRLYFLMAKYAYLNQEFKLGLKYIEEAIEINPKEFYEVIKIIMLEKFHNSPR